MSNNPYVDDSRLELEEAAASLDRLLTPRPLDEYHEDMGEVLWWKFPITEAPYVGSPNDCGFAVQVIASGNEKPSTPYYVGGWPGYHTHFTPIPPVNP